MAIIIPCAACKKNEHEKCQGGDPPKKGQFGGCICNCRCKYKHELTELVRTLSEEATRLGERESSMLCGFEEPKLIEERIEKLNQKIEQKLGSKTKPLLKKLIRKSRAWGRSNTSECSTLTTCTPPREILQLQLNILLKEPF